MKYRPDIDGLRGIAVLAVIGFHTHLGLSGGYVGVDVFFVISGFLITGLLTEEIERMDFSIVRFYERRARRILPALFGVVAFTTIVAFWGFFPDDLINYSKSVSATMTFLSNMLFWLQTGYFDTGAETKPLLHTWSLAVEEQFYIVFPFFLFFCHRVFKGRVPAILALVLVASLTATAVLSRLASSAAFYFAPTRGWELLTGACLAVNAIPWPRSINAGNTASIVGIALILACVLLLHAATSFPWPYAVLPCLGTALVVWGSEMRGTYANRFLSWRPVVFVGLLSYSLYLWHWPLTVFVRYFYIDELSVSVSVAIVGATFASAYISWRFVESPFRGSRSRFSRHQVFALAAVGSVTLASIGLAGYALRGLPGRVPTEVLRLERTREGRLKQPGWCGETRAVSYEKRLQCTVGAPQQVPRFAVWGDSHAGAALATVDQIARAGGIAGIYAVFSGCGPLLGVKRVSGFVAKDCVSANQAAVDTIARSPVKDVILISRWSYNVLPKPAYGPASEKAQVYIVDDSTKSTSLKENKAVFERGLSKSLAALRLAGKRVWIVEEAPYAGYEVAHRVAQAKWRNNVPPRFVAHQDLLMPQMARMDSILEAAADSYAAQIYRISDQLCSENQCAVLGPLGVYYIDDHHLSTIGAQVAFGPLLSRVLERLHIDEVAAKDGRLQSARAANYRSSTSDP